VLLRVLFLTANQTFARVETTMFGGVAVGVGNARAESGFLVNLHDWMFEYSN
jgi:hypothetical protein